VRGGERPTVYLPSVAVSVVFQTWLTVRGKSPGAYVSRRKCGEEAEPSPLTRRCAVDRFRNRAQICGGSPCPLRGDFRCDFLPDLLMLNRYCYSAKVSWSCQSYNDSSNTIAGVRVCWWNWLSIQCYRPIAAVGKTSNFAVPYPRL